MKEFNNYLAPLVFYRTYSRKVNGVRERWGDMVNRAVKGIEEVGKLTPEEVEIIREGYDKQTSLSSGRWMWCGGTDWIKEPKNYYGGYNCMSTNLDDPSKFKFLSLLAMCGTGTGAVLEEENINKLPTVATRQKLTVIKQPGARAPENREEHTYLKFNNRVVYVHVGDSKEGWADGFQALIELAFQDTSKEIKVWEVNLDLGSVRPKGERLKGFGGVSNPEKLEESLVKISSVLNGAVGRKLDAKDCCLLIDLAASAVVAGNIRRCVVQHEVVATKKGLKQIKDVEPFKDFVLTQSGEYKQVTNKFYQGVQRVIEVKTDRTSIKVTPNHRIAMYSSSKGFEWELACNIKPGDRLINIPHLAGEKTINTDWAWLLGLFIADGHADVEKTQKRNGGGGCVIFSVNNQNSETIGNRIIKTLTSYGYTPSVCKQKNSDCTNYCVYRKELALEFLKVKQAYSTPIVPTEILLGDAEVRSAFLAGLCDGDGQTGYRNVLLNSSKLNFLKEVQKLYTSLGIATKLHQRGKKIVKGKEYNGCHYLSLRGLQSQSMAKALIEPFASRVEISLKKAKKFGLGLPMEVLKDLHNPEIKRLTANKKDSAAPRPANWDTLIERGYVNSEWQPLEVISVEQCGQEKTYDLEVSEDACFIANGILVHNSAGQRQFNHTQSSLKENLWQPNEQGVWVIDKSREAMQMANHTRNYYHTPSFDEVYEAVDKQFWTGEGAIFNVSESLARCNADIFPSRAAQRQFMKNLDKRPVEELIREGYVATYKKEIGQVELNHRCNRKGTNPCFTADTLVRTPTGDLPICTLVGRSVNIWDGNDWVTVDNFRVTGTNQSVYKVLLSNGKEVKATYDHNFLLVNGTKVKLNELSNGDELKTYTAEKVFVKDVKYSHLSDTVYCCTVPTTHSFGLGLEYGGIMVGNCGEIIGNEFLCDLSEVHLNQLDPYDEEGQKRAFHAGALNVASLLHHQFLDPIQQQSRELDPIVAVGCTGGFDFFVNLFGVDWLEWWNNNRRLDWSSSTWTGDTYQGIYFHVQEEKILNKWKNWVKEFITEYCNKHNLKVPNRYTTIKPSGTQSLLTKATSGWGPPKGIRYIRRITVGKDDPIALAAMDCGYPVVPSSGSVDENGKLLDDPYDSRVTEWMIEVPIEVNWANIENADQYDPSSFPIESQYSFMMQWQKNYVTHNSSSTLEIYEEEISKLAQLIHSSIINKEGFVSAAVTSRSYQSVSHPRLPFESISKERYDQLMSDIKANRSSEDFYESLKLYDLSDFSSAGPAGCDSDNCELKPSVTVNKLSS